MEMRLPQRGGGRGGWSIFSLFLLLLEGAERDLWRCFDHDGFSPMTSVRGWMVILCNRIAEPRLAALAWPSRAAMEHGMAGQRFRKLSGLF